MGARYRLGQRDRFGLLFFAILFVRSWISMIAVVPPFLLIGVHERRAFFKSIWVKCRRREISAPCCYSVMAYRFSGFLE